MPNKRIGFILTGVVFLNILLLFLFQKFLGQMAQRECFTLFDPVHFYLIPFNASIFIFLLTYIPVLFLIIDAFKKPRLLILFGLGYSFILITRIVGIYFVPLCEPMDAIRLNDELLNSFFYPNGYSAVDLFYSGHTATVFLVYLCQSSIVKKFIFPVLIVLPTLLALQHVHYLVDVAAAIPVTWICFYFAKKLYFLTTKEAYTAR